MSSAFSIGLAGMQAAQWRLDDAAQRVARFGTTSAADGGSDTLAADIVDQHQAQHLYTANLRTVQTADRMLGALLDTFA